MKDSLKSIPSNKPIKQTNSTPKKSILVPKQTTPSENLIDIDVSPKKTISIKTFK